MKSKTKTRVSVIIPVFNEAEVLPALLKELARVFKANDSYHFECYFVDDGSRDESVAILQQQQLVPAQVLVLSRNFGHQAALLAGLEAAEGDLVITMDADLQHPPQVIEQLLAEYERGAEIVFTYRDDGQVTPFLKRVTADLFYWLMNAMSNVKVQAHASDFRLMNRTAVDALLAMPEKRKFLRGMVSWLGFQTATVSFKVAPRLAGKSKYSLKKMVILATYGLASFSVAPLYLSVWCGFGLAFLAFVYMLYVLFIRFFTNNVVQGWSSVILVTLVIGSALSFLNGILAMYIAAIYDEVKQRPIYIIKKRVTHD